MNRIGAITKLLYVTITIQQLLSFDRKLQFQNKLWELFWNFHFTTKIFDSPANVV